jgi:hypothetical protein
VHERDGAGRLRAARQGSGSSGCAEGMRAGAPEPAGGA